MTVVKLLLVGADNPTVVAPNEVAPRGYPSTPRLFGFFDTDDQANEFLAELVRSGQVEKGTIACTVDASELVVTIRVEPT